MINPNFHYDLDLGNVCVNNSVFHVFCNTPQGRESLLQSIYLCQQLENITLSIFVPTTSEFLMYFNSTVVSIPLDKRYLKYAETTEQHINELLEDQDLPFTLFQPFDFTAGSLPDIPVDWRVVTCPRAASEPSTGFGSKIKSILKISSFPVFIPCACFKKWTQVTAFYDGSEFGIETVRMAESVAKLAKVPLTLFTQLDGVEREDCEKQLTEAGIEPFNTNDRRWAIFAEGTFEENLYEVPWNSLVVVGTGHNSTMHELIFGTKLQLIQSILPNPILVAGPQCREEF